MNFFRDYANSKILALAWQVLKDWKKNSKKNSKKKKKMTFNCFHLCLYLQWPMESIQCLSVFLSPCFSVLLSFCSCPPLSLSLCLSPSFYYASNNFKHCFTIMISYLEACPKGWKSLDNLCFKRWVDLKLNFNWYWLG